MLARFRIGPRLILSFGLVLLLNLFAMALIWQGLAETNALFDRIISESLEHERLAHEWAALTRQNGIRSITLLSSPSPEMRDSFSPQVKATSERISAIQKQLEAALAGPEAKAFADDINGRRQAYAAVRAGLIEEERVSRQPLPFARLESELQPVLDAYSQALERYALSFRDQMDRAADQMRERNAQTTRLLLALAVATLALSAFFAWRIARGITTPLRGALALAQSVAAGRLDNPVMVQFQSRDETGELLEALAAMQDGLCGLIGEIRDHAGLLHDAADKLAGATSRITTSSGRQSEAAAAMAASVEELTASINNIADNARVAHSTTVGAGDVAESGARTIHDAVAGMHRISEAVHASSQAIRALDEDSERIALVVGVIREIADQTNLLALNAAIEAARAGESGRGFAVVADEVRKLAERTSASTGQIHATIEKIRGNTQAAVAGMEDGVAETGAGVALAREAGTSIGRINDSSRQVVLAISDISAALREQGNASGVLAANVEKVAQGAEENGASIRDADAEARRLSGLATALERAVGRFVL